MKFGYQRGVALFVALILVALASILATKLTFDGWVERQRTIAILGTEQSLNYELGAEALAADVLVQDLQSSQQDTLTETWAQPLLVPLTSDSNPFAYVRLVVQCPSWKELCSPEI